MRLAIGQASVFAIMLACTGPAFAQATHSNTSGSKSTVTHSTMSGANMRPQEFKTQAEAKAACGSQQVVWANTSSHVLHSASSKYYGKTKHGAYMCESAAMRGGYHMAKSSK